MRIASCIALVLMSACPLVASSQETVVVRPEVIDDVLVNPGIGFMTFQRFNGDTLNEGKKWTEGYPIEYQEFDGNLENENYPTMIAWVTWAASVQPGAICWITIPRQSSISGCETPGRRRR